MNFIYTAFDSDLDEESQTQEVTMAWAIQPDDKNWTNKTPFFHCRDFMNDILLMDKTEYKFSIYGLKYDPNNLKDLSLDLNIVLNLPNEELEFLQENLHYLHKLEKYYDISETTLTELAPENYIPNYNFVLVKANSFWKSHPIALSIYTALLRALTYKLVVKTNIWETFAFLTSSCGYKATDAQIFYRIIQNTNYKAKFKHTIIHLKELCSDVDLHTCIDKNIFRIDPPSYKYNIHNQLGFYSFCQNYTLTSYMTEKLYTIVGNNKNNKEELLCQEDVKVVIPS